MNKDIINECREIIKEAQEILCDSEAHVTVEITFNCNSQDQHSKEYSMFYQKNKHLNYIKGSSKNQLIEKLKKDEVVNSVKIEGKCTRRVFPWNYKIAIQE